MVPAREPEFGPALIQRNSLILLKEKNAKNTGFAQVRDTERCTSDSGRTEPNYSYLLGDTSAAALFNLYYPEANRGAHLVFANAAVGLAGRVVGNLLREFLPRRMTTNVPANGER